jgi:hypothetical protein
LRKFNYREYYNDVIYIINGWLFIIKFYRDIATVLYLGLKYEIYKKKIKIKIKNIDKAL